MTTDVDLVIELAKRNSGHKYDELIKNAEEEMYHDFKSEEATPKMLLFEHLLAFPELFDIAIDVREGKYDEDDDE